MKYKILISSINGPLGYELVKLLKEDIPLPEKAIFITVDDGYRSFYEHAFPVLLKFNFPFSVFISTDYVSNNNNSDFMSWEMLSEIKENLGEIYNHTTNHANLNNQSSDKVYELIEKANQSIEENLGDKPLIFSFPYGISNLENEKIVKNLGFEIAFGQQSSHIYKNENIFRLPRFAFNEKYGNIERFKLIMQSKPLRVYDVTPEGTDYKGNNYRSGFSTKEKIENINCFHSSETPIEIHKIPPHRIELTLKENPKKGLNRINCTLKKKDTLHWYGRILIN